MSGTFVIDPKATFSRALLVSVGPKVKFGSQDEQDTNRDGVPKWVAEVAVSWQSINGMPAPSSEMITVTITAPRDPAESAGVAPGQEIGFDVLWMGVTAAEKTERGNVKGGKPWYGASGLYPVTASNGKAAQAAASVKSGSSSEHAEG